MHRQDIAALAGTALFDGIGVIELDELVGTTASSVREFRAGSLMLAAGSPYDSLWILVEGSVEAEMESGSGKTIRIETIRAPEPLASAILFAPEPTMPVSVRALEDVRIICIPRESVLTIAQRSRAFLANFLRDAGSRVASLSERFRLMQFATLRERLADWLLRQPTTRPENTASVVSIALPSSKEKLADTFGVTRPSLSRGFGELAREGLIALDGKKVIILDRRGLEEIVDRDENGII